MTISRNDLMAALKQLNGCAIAGIDTITVEPLTGGKKNPMKDRITKVMNHGSIMFFCNLNNNGYDAMVKRRLEKEGKNPESFKLGKRVWGERVPNTPFVLHKGEVYVETIFLHSPKDVSYLLDGAPIDKADIEGLKVKKVEGVQGGLNDKVIIRTYKLKSIQKLRMGDLSVG